jgi:hypothetical protein
VYRWRAEVCGHVVLSDTHRNVTVSGWRAGGTVGHTYLLVLGAAITAKLVFDLDGNCVAGNSSNVCGLHARLHALRATKH